MVRNKIIPYRKDLKPIARTLRKNMSLAEVKLWNKIRRKQLGVKFHRQTPMLDYIVDFYCHELKVAIEVDGAEHTHSDIAVLDMKRQQRIEAYGDQFLRFENREIKYNLDSVLQEIKDWIKMNK